MKANIFLNFTPSQRIIEMLGDHIVRFVAWPLDKSEFQPSALTFPTTQEPNELYDLNYNLHLEALRILFLKKDSNYKNTFLIFHN